MRPHADLVLPSVDCKSILEAIHQDGAQSTAYYLAGPYTTGKTNTLGQIMDALNRQKTLVTYVDGDLNLKKSKWQIIVDALQKLPFVADFIRKNERLLTQDDFQNCLICCRAFNPLQNPDMKDTELIVVLVDEAQNFASLDKECWYQFVRELIRKRHNVHLVASSSSFELLVPEENSKLESPFNKKVFYTTYFNENLISDAIALLQGKDDYYVHVSNQIKQDIVQKIFSETEGHPHLCSYYFTIIRSVFIQVSSSTYSPTANVDQVLELWNQLLLSQLPTQINTSRLKDKIAQADPFTLLEIEKSGIFYSGTVPFQIDQRWQLELLRLGIGKIIETKMLVLSCNIVRNFYFQSLRASSMSVKCIAEFCHSPDKLNLLEVIIHIFSLLPVYPFQIKASYVMSRVKKNVLGPSEKQYQCQIYRFLSELCRGNQYWRPTAEKKIEGSVKEKVDLALIYYNPLNQSTVQEYLIELGCNCSVLSGAHSAESHYVRQKENYNKPGQKSVVIMIYTHKFDSNYFWPSSVDDSVAYVVVQHLIEDTPNKITMYFQDKSHLELDISKNQ